MATRCYILKENKDKSLIGIYCHYDGYPSHMLPTLRDNYQTEEEIDKLLAIGDINHLHDTIEKCERIANTTKQIEFKDINYLQVHLDANCDIEFAYIWEENKGHNLLWTYASPPFAFV